MVRSQNPHWILARLIFNFRRVHVDVLFLLLAGVSGLVATLLRVIATLLDGWIGAALSSTDTVAATAFTLHSLLGNDQTGASLTSAYKLDVIALRRDLLLALLFFLVVVLHFFFGMSSSSQLVA